MLRNTLVISTKLSFTRILKLQSPLSQKFLFPLPVACQNQFLSLMLLLSLFLSLITTSILLIYRHWKWREMEGRMENTYCTRRKKNNELAGLVSVWLEQFYSLGIKNFSSKKGVTDFNPGSQYHLCILVINS